MNKTVNCLVVLCFMVFFISEAFSADIKTVNVRTEAWAKCTEKDGSGLYFDILRAVCGLSGIKMTYTIVPYKRSVYSVATGKADLAIGVYPGEVENVIYPEYHFFVDDISAVFLKSEDMRWRGEKSLENRSVVWLSGYAYDKYIRYPMKMYEIKTQAKALELVRKKRYDFYLGPAVVIKSELDPAVFNMEFVKWIRMYMVFPDTGRGRALARIWDNNFGNLLENGAVKTLFKKYEMMEYYQY